MGSIQINSSNSTELSNEFSQLNQIEIDEGDVVGGGGFGEVFSCVSIDGKIPGNSLVVKILTNEVNQNIKTIQKLQNALRKKNRELKLKRSSLLDEYPGLIAVPQCSFLGKWNGKEIAGYVMYNLRDLGFHEFSEILGTKVVQKFDALYNNGIDGFNTCVKVSYQFARTMRFLSEIDFLHADIKEESLFVNVNSGICAVIDFDSGAIGTDVPTTKGAGQGWYAPEITDLIGSRGSGGNRRVNRFTENWSVAVGLHYIMFGFHPYHFLKTTVGTAVEVYLDDLEWPNISINHPSKNDFRDTEIGIHQSMFDLLGLPLQNAFKTTFNTGFSNPKARKEPKEWEKAFALMWDKPEIIWFEASDYFVASRKTVRITWSTRNANRILINETEVTNEKHYDFVPNTDSVMQLTAINEVGIKTQKECHIQVSKEPPTIQSFESDKVQRDDVSPVTLSWHVINAEKLILNPGNIDVTNLSSFDVFPIKITTYSLEAYSFFGVKSKSEISIKVSQEAPKVKLFKASTTYRMDKTPVELSWDVEGAEEVILRPEGRTLSSRGSLFVDPRKNTNYTLVSTSMFGVETQKEVSIEVSNEPPAIKFLKADKKIREDITPVILTWQVGGAEKLTLQPGNIDVTHLHSYEVTPLKNTTYVLEVTSYFNVNERSEIQVKVSDKPAEIDFFNTSARMRTDKTPVQLSWNVSGAEDVVLEPFGISVPSSGDYEVAPLKDTIYTLRTATMFGVKNSKECTVQVSREPPTIEEFSARLVELESESYELFWKTKDAECVEILPDVGDVSHLNGILLKEPYDIELVATSMFGFQAKKALELTPLFMKGVDEEIFTLHINDELFKSKPNNNIFKK